MTTSVAAEFSMAQRLTLRPDAFAQYDGESTEFPLLLQPAGQPETDTALPNSPVASFARLAQTALGADILAFIPRQYSTVSPPTVYKARFVYRLRTLGDYVTAENEGGGTPKAYHLPEGRGGRGDTGTGIPQVAPWFVGPSVTLDRSETSRLPILRKDPLNPILRIMGVPGYALLPLLVSPQLQATTDTYPPLVGKALGDEVGVLIVPEDQPWDGAGVRTWNQADDEALFASLGANTPVASASATRPAIGAWLVTGRFGS